MPKKDIDWGNLPFSYMKTDYSYVCNYKDGAWGEGFLTLSIFCIEGKF